MDKKEVSILIKAIRDKHNLQQNTLANMIGVAPVTVYRWEKGLINIHKYHLALLKYLYVLDTNDLINAMELQMIHINKLKKKNIKELNEMIMTSNNYVGTIILGLILNELDIIESALHTPGNHKLVNKSQESNNG